MFILKRCKTIMVVCLFNTAVQLEHNAKQNLSLLTIPYHHFTSPNSVITIVLTVKLCIITVTQ